MAVVTCPIQMRMGNEANYDKTKMLPAEFAVSLDEKILRIAFAAGDDRKIVFETDLQTVVETLEYEIEQIADSPAKFS